MAGRRPTIKPVTATYRLQFTPEFTFERAQRVVPYLAELGVSHIYASPIFRSRSGSEHGYDVLDHNEINPELGGRDGFDSLIRTAHDHGLGWIQDVVPNHMAYSPDNPLLVDLFENGSRSSYHGFFDIDWQAPYQAMEGRVVAPFLGGLYGEVLNRGELRLEYTENGFAIVSYDKRFPLRVETYRDVLSRRLGALESRLGREDPDMLKLLGVLYTLESLQSEEDPGVRTDKIGFVKRMLWELYRGSNDVRTFLTQSVDDFNGTPGDPDSFSPLNELHWKQVYRLAFWKVASEEINYRRFFSINDLICLRVEDDAVFEHAHRLLFDLVDAGAIDGLRIDHIDGLYEPGRYLQRLRDRVGERPIYVEKILHPGETLPDHWPVEGTTGYDTLNLVNGLFISAKRSKRIRSFYRSFTGNREEYEAALSERKRRILIAQMSGDLDNLTRYMRRVVGADRHGIDITAPSLRRALGEVMVYLPVYRTYVTDRINRDADVGYIKTALSVARRQLPQHGYELDYIESFLLLSFADHVSDEAQRRWNDVVLRFQQFTGPLMAKGLEDTLMYGYVPLISVNEVGGSPELIGTTARDFHAAMRRLVSAYPRTMTASSTHDTKRGEDTRLRVSLLSHYFDEWSKAVRRWRSANKHLRKRVGAVTAPDANDEYLIYQTIVGVLPSDGSATEELRDRLRSYIVKAIREAKRHTNWTNPNEAYEAAVLGFVDGVLTEIADATASGARSGDESFGASFAALFGVVTERFRELVLAHQAVRLALPGVPDTYRGSEFLDLTLVDPDNRRPVEWAERRGKLAATDSWVEAALARAGDGGSPGGGDTPPPPEDVDGAKLALVRLLLTLRRRNPDLFLAGDYVPLSAVGVGADELIAFARVHGERALIVVAGRSPSHDASGPVVLQVPYELSDRPFVELTTGELPGVTEAGVELPDRLARRPVLLLWRTPA
ncbi:MAG: malto-oligosyltrehalose synthase [bacterium]